MADKQTRAKPNGFPIKPGDVFVVGKYENGDDWMFDCAGSDTGYILIDLVDRIMKTSYVPQAGAKPKPLLNPDVPRPTGEINVKGEIK